MSIVRLRKDLLRCKSQPREIKTKALHSFLQALSSCGCMETYALVLSQSRDTALSKVLASGLEFDP